MLILVRVARWSAASLKTDTAPQMMLIDTNLKQGMFSGCFALLFKFPENQNVPRYAALTEGETIIRASSEYFLTCKERKRIKKHCGLIGQENLL